MSSDSSELHRLQAAGIDLMRNTRPTAPPVLFFVKPIYDWYETRLIEILRQTAAPEIRPAFNPVFVHLAADGSRLTELAAKADMSKQAMSEIVDELIDLGYLARFADPTDRRAKLILRSEKGLELHKKAMAAFAQIDRELTALIGEEAIARLRRETVRAAEAIRQARPQGIGTSVTKRGTT